MQTILNRLSQILHIAFALVPLVAFAVSAHADIFQWEYIDPADPSQGKRQSTTLAPDGAGVDAFPGAELAGRNLTMAYLIGAELTNSNARASNLTNADLSQTNLTNSDFLLATLMDADFTDAHVRGARFDATEPCGPFACPLPGTGLTLAQLYSTASYQAHNLDGIGLAYNYLAGGNFAGQDLTNANFHAATLTGADFTSSVVRGASFYAGGTGLTMAQLDSTASYQAQDLTDIGLDGDLSGWNFAGQNLANANFHAATLTGANFRDANLANAIFSGYYSCDECFPPGSQVSATLTDADFTGAEVRGAHFHDTTSKGFTAEQLYSTASYQARDLTGISLSSNDLTSWTFAGQNLSNANFEGATLTDADFIGAEVSGVNFAKEYVILNFPPGIPIPVARGTGISPAQLCSTAGYQAGDLSGINFSYNDLAGSNFAGQNLTKANFRGAALTDTDFTGAKVRGASFGRDEICVFFSCQLTSGLTLEQLYSTASYEEHDVRGVSGLDLSNAITTNLILPNGHIDGLDLDGGGLLVLRDYDGAQYDPSLLIPITVDQHLAMGPGGTLRMVFEANAWDSTISFEGGIPVALGGTLELTFAADVDLASQVGRTVDLFDWTGVTPTGAFDISTPYAWDLSNLYTTGEVTLTAVPESTSIALAAALGVIFLPRRRRTQKNASRRPSSTTSSRSKDVASSTHSHSRKETAMNRPALRLTIVVVLAMGTTLRQDSSYAAALRTVALSGQPAAGALDGATYSSFGAHFVFEIPDFVYRGPVINDAGHVAFRANLAGAGVDSTNNQGIWSEGSGSLGLVARVGSAAPGAPDGVNFGLNPALELFTPVLNNSGQTAFYGGLTDGTVGLWSEGSGSLALVARDGMQVSGAPDGVNHSFAVLRDFFPDLPKLNDAGQTAFNANLTGEGVDNTNDWGVWSEGSGSLAMVARSGGPALDTPEGVNYDSFFFQSGFNDAGQTAFFAFVTGSGVDPSNDQGIWSEGSGSLALLARSGSPAPSTAGGVNFREFFYPVTINNAGQTAFSAWLTGDGVDATNNEGIWSDASGTLALVARSGDAAPGTPGGVNFDAFSLIPNAFLGLNDAGQIAFRGNLNGTGVTATNNRGIWVEGGEGLELLARTGDPAPGTAAGVRFSGLSRPTLNDAGQVAFRGDLTGTGVFSSNNLGIWATDESGAVQLIARKGTLVEVAPGDSRTISDLGFVTDSGNSDGRASAFNNLGQVVFWARFTNGTQGVFVSSLVAHLPGDFNNDLTVDAADYVVWRVGLGTTYTPEDYDVWQANFGRTLLAGSGAALPSAAPLSAAVPEPASIALAATALSAFTLGWRRKRKPESISQSIHQGIRGKLMESFHPRSNRSISPRTSFARRARFVIPFVLGAALHQASPVIAQPDSPFDASRKSPAIIPFDPDATIEARSGYVSGRVPTSVKGPVNGGTNINTMLGAETFYSEGFTGTNAVIANIEAGHIWSGHETLTHVQQIPNHPSALNEIDRHATWVATMLAGRRAGANPGAYQEGLAPDAGLYSGAIATQFEGQRPAGRFQVNNASTFDQFRRAFSTGVNDAGRRADVINSSWGSTGTTNGSDTHSIAFDGFANTDPRTLFVVAAGNSGPGPDQVWSPAAAYNNLAVAALGPNPPYDRPAFFSSGGPNDYADPINGTKNNARQAVDIAAPGENLAAAYYGGETGGNGTTDNPAVAGPGPTGLPSGSLGGPDFYHRGGVGGTSFAAPTVAGGAALLYDAAYSVFGDNADARDARVMKSVLMNSADKTVGWNNGQVTHPNGNGGVLTTQGLDNRVGTGRMNLDAAFDQFLLGATDVAGTSSGNLGLVSGLGWDFGQVVSGTTNDYFFDAPLDAGAMLTATLTWFRDRRIIINNTLLDDSYDDLNLELWSVVDGTPASLISESSSLYNESEHFSFAVPSTGDYALRVRWFKEVFDRVADADQEFYGLAWSSVAALGAVTIPEPGSVLLAAMAAAACGTFRRREGYGKKGR